MALISMLLLLTGCPPAEQGDPTVTIVAPADGATTGTSVTLTVEVENFDLVAPETARRAHPPRRAPAWTPFDLLPAAQAHDPSAPPEGYVEITVDGTVIDDTIALTSTLTLTAGEHTIGVELFYPDGDSFFPAVEDQVTVTAE